MASARPDLFQMAISRHKIVAAVIMAEMANSE
jgi:hypothetical protein